MSLIQTAAVERLEEEGGSGGGGSGGGAPSAAAWSVVHTDADWSTRFEWGRPHALSTLSFATVSWHVPPGTPPGTYRLRHFGDHKPWFGRWVLGSHKREYGDGGGGAGGRLPGRPRLPC